MRPVLDDPDRQADHRPLLERRFNRAFKRRIIESRRAEVNRRQLLVPLRRGGSID